MSEAHSLCFSATQRSTCVSRRKVNHSIAQVGGLVVLKEVKVATTKIRCLSAKEFHKSPSISKPSITSEYPIDRRRTK